MFVNKANLVLSFFLQWIPPLCFELKLLIVTGYEHFAELCVGDVANEFDAFDLLDLLMVADGDGKEQFVVFAAIEGAGGDVHVHLLCHHGSLIVDGNVLLVNPATDARLLADMEEF